MTEDEHRQQMDLFARLEAKRLFNEYVEEWERKRNLELNELICKSSDLASPKGDAGGYKCYCGNRVAFLYPKKYPCPYCGYKFRE